MWVLWVYDHWVFYSFSDGVPYPCGPSRLGGDPRDVMGTLGSMMSDEMEHLGSGSEIHMGDCVTGGRSADRWVLKPSSCSSSAFLMPPPQSSLRSSPLAFFLCLISPLSTPWISFSSPMALIAALPRRAP